MRHRLSLGNREAFCRTPSRPHLGRERGAKGQSILLHGSDRGRMTADRRACNSSIITSSSHPAFTLHYRSPCNASRRFEGAIRASDTVAGEKSWRTLESPFPGKTRAESARKVVLEYAYTS
jgi:hypothetical protein